MYFYGSLANYWVFFSLADLTERFKHQQFRPNARSISTKQTTSPVAEKTVRTSKNQMLINDKEILNFNIRLADIASFKDVIDLTLPLSVALMSLLVVVVKVQQYNEY